MDASLIRQAAAALRRGEVVGLPTETVYGLAADATSEAAVAKIFALKGRPSTNPLIAHVASIDIARRYVRWDDRATALFNQFAPGPLSVVLPRNEKIVDAVSAGRSTVAIRIPDHPVAMALLREVDLPLAAPSANKSNHVSPTTAQHVRDEFGDAVPIVLDGGPCRVGIESTVLDLSSTVPTILRPGSISRAMIEQVIGPVSVFAGHIDASVAAASPGQHARHYSPRKPAFRFDASPTVLTDRIAVIAPNNVATGANPIPLPADPLGFAAGLYDALRRADAMNDVDEIWIWFPPDSPQWAAVRDRIARATQPPFQSSRRPRSG
jgi:L-threonylcarbamoyladenylate synthase